MKRHNCGGSILVADVGEQAHTYCDRCGAYTYDPDGCIPSGTDAARNREAWDSGDDESPDAE